MKKNQFFLKRKQRFNSIKSKSMQSKKQIIPRESALQLYKKLVKEDEQTNSKYPIREYSRSSEQEVMRVLEILSLLPTCIENKNDDTPPTSQQNVKNQDPIMTPSKRERISSSKEAMMAEEQRRKRLTSSPYNHDSLKSKRHKKAFNKRSSSHSTTINTCQGGEPKKMVRRVRRNNDEYIWHPITIKTGEGGKKKEKIVQDVMKYYREQYHRNVPNQSVVKIKKK